METNTLNITQQMIDAAKEYSSNSVDGFTANNPERYKAFRDGQDSGYEIAQTDTTQLKALNAALKESNEVLLDALKEIRNNIRFDIAMPQYTTDARLTDIIFRAENKILTKA